MAASDARPVPKKNVAFRLYLAIRKNDGTLITSWAGQDTELSLDGGAFADATNEATEIGTSGVGYIDLTSSETNYDSVVVKTTVTNASALPFVAVLYPEETGDIRADATAISGDSTAADNLEAACDGGSYNVGGGAVVAASVTGAVGSVTGNVGGNVAGSVASVAGAVGSVTGNVGGNVAGSVASVTADVGITQTAADKVWGSAARTLTSFGTLVSDIWAAATRTLTTVADSSGVTTLLSRIVGTLAAGTHNAQSGDAYARLGAPAGASVSADIAAIEAQTDDIGAAGAGLTAIPWNAAWDTEVQSEATDALNAYDPPTNAEMEARTIVAANYALQASVDDLEGRLTALRAAALDNLDATISSRAAATTALSNVVWTDAKAGYLTGAVALEATLTAIKGAGWTTETLAAIDALIDAIKAKTDLIPASPAAVGSAMTLADDAITSAKFDESTAFPMKSADTGATAVARTGADADTLKTLSDQIDGVAGAAADPLLNAVPGAYADGTGGKALGLIASILSKTNLIAADGTTTIAAPVNGDDITIHRGDTLQGTITGLGSLVGRTALYWSVKRRTEESDDDALLRVEETAGLQRLNGAAVEGETLGTIVVTDQSAGDLTITLDPTVTVELSPASRLVWDIQMITATGVTTLAQGAGTITADVTRAITAPPRSSWPKL